MLHCVYGCYVRRWGFRIRHVVEEPLDLAKVARRQPLYSRLSSLYSRSEAYTHLRIDDLVTLNGSISIAASGLH